MQQNQQSQQDLQNEQELLLDLFEHEGWKLFIEEKQVLLDSLKENADNNCPTNDMWQFNRGVVMTLRSITSYEAALKFVVDQQKQEDEFSQE